MIANGARVEVRQYDRSLAGAEYICKCLGANAYELNKYSFANTVTLSASVIRLIAGIDASGDRRCGSGHMKKRAGGKSHGAITAGGSRASSLYDETASRDAGKNRVVCLTWLISRCEPKKL
jgi:hypothetical protein